MAIAADSRVAELSTLGLLSVGGDDARAFLHAQLTNDIEHLAADRARYAGWCSAKGRLLASFLVVPYEGGFLLQLARDLVPAVARRLATFVLRSRVGIIDLSQEWRQYGVTGEPQWASPDEELKVVHEADWIEVRIGPQRRLRLCKSQIRTNAGEEEWRLGEIRAGRPLVTQATQDQFVPQMVNYQMLGGVDFQKGCYPGQEIVARAQYRGQVKRRMYHVRSAEPLRAGQELLDGTEPAGTVLNAAADEALAVLQIDSVEQMHPIRAQPGGSALELLALPYQTQTN